MDEIEQGANSGRKRSILSIDIVNRILIKTGSGVQPSTAEMLGLRSETDPKRNFYLIQAVRGKKSQK